MEASILSVIIPAFNEEQRLPLYLDRISSYLPQKWSDFEIIVVDDGSRDGTSAVVERLAAADRRIRLVRLPENRGKGFAVKSGMLAARGELCLFTDADGATPIEEIERLLPSLRNGADVVIASRALASEDCSVDGKIHRKVMGTVFNLIVQGLAVPGIRDTQCGFKLFSRRAVDAVFPLQTIDGFGFDLELLFIARRLGLSIAEIPVNWSDVGGTKVRLLQDSLRMFADVAQVRLNALKGVYN